MKQVIQYSKDWKDKIFIDTKAINGIAETLPAEINFTDKLDYSVTPTTLKKVTFKKDLAEPIFTEEYAFKENLVIRFGINIHNKEFRKILDNELNIHNQKLLEEILEQSEKITNISGQTNYEKFSKHIQLTKCENYVLKEAVDYMNTNSKKAVLVDIFPRESSQNKKTQEPAGRIDLEKLEIHTVLLYKTEEKKVLTIDPNNPMFSTHLNKYVGCKIETLCSTALEHKIYSRPDGSNTGYASNKFRDCIDIAVKLGLLLDQDKTAYGTIEDIIKSQATKLITNNPLLHNMKFSIDNLIREKQSSDIDKVILSNQKMKDISDKITQEDSRYKEEIKKIEDEHFYRLNELSQSKTSLIGELQNLYDLELLGHIQEEI
jgi:hypothetical protein